MRSLIASGLGLCALLGVANAEPGSESVLGPELIDAGVASVLEAEGLEAAPLVGDAAFLRRASLDLRGTIPTLAELEDASRPRVEAIDRLLASPAYARRLAEETADLLLVRLSGEGGTAYAREAFTGWLERAFAADRPYNQLAATLLAAEGRTDQDPSLYYLLDRGLGQQPEDVADSAAQRFMGLSLACARCHDHPFDASTQADFHGVAAYFARLRIRQRPGMRGAYDVREAPLGEHRATFTGGTRAEREPRVPGPGFAPQAADALSPGVAPSSATGGSRRVAFVRWLTSPENPWFARAIVNRVWGRFFGRGLVEPIDDLAAAESSPHAGLLAKLAAAFVQDGWSLRRLHRAIASSKAYQRSATITEHPAPERARAAYAIAPVRPLPAAVVAASLLRAAGRDEPGEGELARVHQAMRQRLRVELERALPSPRAGERPDPSAVTTAMGVFFLTGRAPNGLVRGPVLSELLRRWPKPTERIGALFARTLARGPRPDELRATRALIDAREGDPSAYQDVFWALIASSEFLTNH